LHDDLGQQLAGAWMMADVLQRTLMAEKSPQSAAAKKISELLQKALSHTRSLARGLHPVSPEQGGFRRALQNLAAQSSEMFGVKCRFECSETAPNQIETSMMHLYRITQEAVSNAVKHGKAKNIRIRLTSAALTISDDGSGLQANLKGDGMGLRIMRYRAEMCGGTFSVRNGRSKGVVVSCEFPPTTSHAEENESTSIATQKARPHRR
jgi:signal transduction histidine kinase